MPLDLSGITSVLGLAGGLVAIGLNIYRKHVFDDEVQDALVKKKDFIRNYIKDCLSSDPLFLNEKIKNSAYLTFVNGRINSRKGELKDIEKNLENLQNDEIALEHLYEMSSMAIARMICDQSLRLNALIEFYNQKNPDNKFSPYIDNRIYKQELALIIQEIFDTPLIIRERIRKEKEKREDYSGRDYSGSDNPQTDFRSTLSED